MFTPFGRAFVSAGMSDVQTLPPDDPPAQDVSLVASGEKTREFRTLT